MHAKQPSRRVASLHLHPVRPGDPLKAVEFIEVVVDKGIVGEPRYFGRVNQTSGKPSRRQLSLIEREQIAEHAATLGLQTIPPGAIRSNIETLGINLVPLVGRELAIGDAVLFLYEPRTPCARMEAICIGLKAHAEDCRQGVMAQVVKSGRITVNDPIRLVKAQAPV